MRTTIEQGEIRLLPTTHRKLRRRLALPDVVSRTDWRNGYFSGLAIGAVIGLSMAVIFLPLLRR